LTTHQVAVYFGPTVAVGGSEVYLGMAPMAPTWVRYRESYEHKQGGAVVERYDRRYSGFFGSCRTLVGVQVPVSDRFRMGTELVIAFFNYMPLKSGDREDNSFQFPSYRFAFTARYEL